MEVMNKLEDVDVTSLEGASKFLDRKVERPGIYNGSKEIKAFMIHRSIPVVFMGIYVDGKGKSLEEHSNEFKLITHNCPLSTKLFWLNVNDIHLILEEKEPTFEILKTINEEIYKK